MAGDDLFPAEGEAKASEPQPESQPNKDVAAEQSAAPRGITDAQLTQAFQQLDTVLQGLGQRLEAIEQRAAGQGPAPAQNGSEDRFSELAADPEAFVQKRVKAGIDEGLKKLVEPLKRIGGQVATLNQNQVQRDFDQELGEGAWAEAIAPHLPQAMGNLPVDYGDQDTIRALVKGLVGDLYTSSAGREKLEKIMERKQKAQAPVMLSGSRSTPDVDRLTPAESDFVDRMKKAGVYDDDGEKVFLDAKKRGNQESDWGATWMKSQKPALPPVESSKETEFTNRTRAG